MIVGFFLSEKDFFFFSAYFFFSNSRLRAGAPSLASSHSCPKLGFFSVIKVFYLPTTFP